MSCYQFSLSLSGVINNLYIMEQDLKNISMQGEDILGEIFNFVIFGITHGMVECTVTLQK